MGSTKTYLLAILFVFSISVVSLSAQTRVQKLYSRSMIDGVRESTPTKKIIIQVFNKYHKPFVDSYVKVTGTELEFEANDDGQISVELPADLKYEDIELHIIGKNYRSKTINISFDDFSEVYREIKLTRITRTGGCPSF